MSAKAFDRKFGAELIASLPDGPGVYRYWGEDGALLYVGKAVSLRARLRQYRAATRKKVHRKLREIVDQATQVTWETCESELAALLLENELIRSHRPPLNVAGAFSFLYPLVGWRRSARDLELIRTTSPGEFTDVQWSGAFRSRETTQLAFESMVELLGEVGHVEKSKGPKVPYTRVARFRQVPLQWDSVLDAYWQGTGSELLQTFILELVQRPGARRRAKEIQAHLKVLRVFFLEESAVLRGALAAVGQGNARGVPQPERDALFLKAKARGWGGEGESG